MIVSPSETIPAPPDDPRYTDDRIVRWRRIRSTGAMVLWHPCEVCGLVDAPYGYECSRTSLGRWRCGEHKL